MQTALLPIMRDYLVRFQQTAIKETGRRPLCWLRSPKDEALVIPGCRRPGYAFWQPISWKDDQAPLGEHTAEFHQSIVDYLSLCQFLEIRFFCRWPVLAAHTASCTAGCLKRSAIPTPRCRSRNFRKRWITPHSGPSCR